MIITKQQWLKRSLSLLTALVMCAGTVSVAATAATPTAKPTTKVDKIDVPIEDGVYYANIDLWNATTNQPSMGNAALRGSTSFKQKQPNDTYSKAILVVEDNKATAIVEFMPMGYIGMYGFMMELESVDVNYLQQWGGVYDKDAVFTPATVLARHMTQDGKIVYDAYNNPDSSSVFNGQKKRPAGFGYEEDRTVDISDIPYSHILSLDVTPITVGEDAVPESPDAYTWENAAYVHVFVPVMFDISASSGDQYARMKVDWASAEKIEEPENNLQYSLWSARQIEQGNFTDSSYAHLQNTIEEITLQLENIWPNQTISMSGTGFSAQPNLEQKEYSDTEKAEMSKNLNEAVSALEVKGEKETLDSLIKRANQISEALYTVESYALMKEAIVSALAVQCNEDAGVSEVNRAVQNLTDKIEALIYKNADYSAVDTAIEKVPDDLSVYTDASVQAVNDAIDLVIRGKNITEQDDVDAMAKKIDDAISALELKGTDVPLDRNSLENGVYSIYGEMIKVNRQDRSMSNDAINHTVKLTVDDGRYYITLDFHGLQYLNRFGYLAKLSYYGEGYTYGQYGKIEGTLIPAEILSTQKNADGSDVVDEFNQVGGSSEGLLYPDQLKFELVSDALNDEDGYVPLHVFVPVMEDISEGTGDQDVLLQLDWSTLTRTTEDDPGFQPEPPVELSPEFDYADHATGVKIHADKGVFGEGVTAVIKRIDDGADHDTAKNALSDFGTNFKLYDICFVDTDGTGTEPNGKITISIPVPNDFTNPAVYRIVDGKKTLMSGSVENGMFTFVTMSAGEYAIVDKTNPDSSYDTSSNYSNSSSAVASASMKASDNTANPETGAAGALSALAVLALSVATVSKKRKDK